MVIGRSREILPLRSRERESPLIPSMKPHKFSTLARFFLLCAVAVLILSCRQSGSSETTPAPQPSPGPDVKVTFLSAGDIMLSRGVERAISKAGDPLAPFKPLAEVLQ